jgi:hypothetical protein
LLDSREEGNFADVTPLERKMHSVFVESVPMLGGNAHTDWGFFLLRSTRMPTRLIDGERARRVVVRISADPENEERGCGHEVDLANEKSPTPRDDIFDLKRTFVFQPFHNDRRISQRGFRFTVTPGKDKFLPLEQNNRGGWRCRSSSAGALRDELRLLGVSQRLCSRTYRAWAQTFSGVHRFGDHQPSKQVSAVGDGADAPWHL